MKTEPTRILVGETAEIEAAIRDEPLELADVVYPFLITAQLLRLTEIYETLNQTLKTLRAHLERV